MTISSNAVTTDPVTYFSVDTTIMGQLLAVLMFVIVINSLKRLVMGVRARLTSWGLFLIVISGFLFIRMPEALGWTTVLEYQQLVRLVVYLVALALNVYDWYLYAQTDEHQLRVQGQKEREREREKEGIKRSERK